MNPLPPLGVYLHLPWCVRKCPYCDFNSHRGGDAGQRNRYVEALVQDIKATAPDVSGRAVDSVFIGGGTPSLFEPEEIGALLSALGSELDLAADAEITLEANPGALECGRLSGYRALGVNRLSLGAQSFDDEMLARLGRIHTSADIREAFSDARRAGFEDINLDLMFALPGQDRGQAMADLDAALELLPSHLSWYELTLEPNTVFFARPPADLPDADDAADIQEAGLERLAAAGFERYEISAFSRPGRRCRHNLNYWTFGDYLGLGAGAHGKLTGPAGNVARTARAANPEQYVRGALEGSGGGETWAVLEAELGFEFMLNALRLADGFDESLYVGRTGQPIGTVLPGLERLEGRGLLARSTTPGRDVQWQPTSCGFRFVNELQAEFLVDSAAGPARPGPPSRGANP